MALDRTNMVSLLDIGALTGSTEKLAEMGDGYTELTEDWGPNTESKQYVNMKNASNTVKGYAFSMTPSREYLSDDMQTAIDTMFKTFPTGDKCNTYYYRLTYSHYGRYFVGSSNKHPRPWSSTANIL